MCFAFSLEWTLCFAPSTSSQSVYLCESPLPTPGHVVFLSWFTTLVIHYSLPYCFTAGLILISFTNSSHRRLYSSLRTVSTDRIFWANPVLWPPYGIGQAIIFLPMWFLSFFCIPRLISAAADWMSTILLRMVWPLCEFRMQVWNVLQAARWKCRTQNRQKFAIWNRRTTLSGYIVATKACIDNRKKNLLNSNISSICSHNTVNVAY